MTENVLGLALDLEKTDVFISMAANINATLDRLSLSAEKTATAFNKIDLGKLKFDVSGLEKLNAADLDAKSAALQRAATAYSAVVQSLSNADPAKLSEFNKALSGGAQAGTIDAKAMAFSKFAVAAGEVAKVKFGTSATTITELVKALQGKIDLSQFDKLDTVSKNLQSFTNSISGIVKELGTFSGKKIAASTTLFPELVNNLNKLSNIPFDKISNGLPALSNALEQFAKALRTFTSGKHISDLPVVVQNSIHALEAFINVIQKLQGAQSGLSFNDFTTGMASIAVAIEAVAKAFRTFGGKSAQDIAGLQTALQTVFKGVAGLNTATNNIKPIDNLTSITDLAKALGELGSAFSRLSRLKGLQEFPTIVKNINDGFSKLNVDKLVLLGKRLTDSIGPFTQFVEAARLLKQVQTVDVDKLTRNMQGVGPSADVADRALRVVLGTFKLLGQGVAALVPHFANLIGIFAKFSVNTVIAGFNALRAIFVTLPFNAVVGGFNLLVGAVKAVMAVFRGIFAPFIAVRDALVNIDRQAKLNARAFGVLLAPIRALISILSPFVAILVQVVSIAGKLGSIFNPFKSSADSVSSSAEKASQSLNKLSQSATVKTGDTNSLNKLNQELDKVDDNAKTASSGMQQFNSSVNVSNLDGAVNTLGRLALTMKSLEVVGGVVGSLFNKFRSSIENTITGAIQATAAYENMFTSISILLGKEALQASPDLFPGVLAASKEMGEQATALLERFQLLAIASPFERDDIAQGFKTAQVYGFASDAAERLTNAVVDVSAAYGLAGHNIAEIILPIGQIQSLGRVQLQDAKQLAQRGIPVFEYWANALGTTVAKVQELISAGALKSDFAIQTLVTGLEKDFAGASASATATITGLISTWSDLRKEIGRALFTPVINEIKPFVASFLSLENIQAQIAGATAKGEEIGAVFAGFVIPAIKSFVALFNSIPQPILTAVSLFGKWIGATLAITLALGVLKLALGAVLVTLGVLVSPIVLVSAGIAAAAGIIILNFENIMRVGTALKDSLMAIPSAIVGAFSGDTSLLSNILKPFENVGDIGTTLASPFIAGFNFIKKEFINFVTVFSGLFATIGTTIAGQSSSILSGLSGLLSVFVTFGSNIINSFTEGIVNTYDILNQAIMGIGDILFFWLAPGSPPKVAPEIDKWGEFAILEFAGGMLSAISSGFQIIFSTLQNTLSSGFSSVGQTILQTLATIGAVAVTAIGGTIVNSIGLIFNTLNGIAEVIASIAVGIGSQIFIIIDAIIQTIAVLDKPQKAFVNFTEIIQIWENAAVASFQNFANVLQGVFSGVLQILGGIVAFINGQYVTAFIALSYVSASVKGSLDTIAAGARDFLGGVQAALNGAELAFANSLSNVVSYGAAMVNAFAEGILMSVSAVANALAAIGDMVSYWLAPGSPPRIAPDIDKWGTSAAEEFLKGFSEADLNTIGDFGSSIEEILKVLEVPDVDVENVVRTFAEGFSNIQGGGDFGAENMARITELAGEAAPEVEKLTSRYIDLINEQSTLNALTKQYDTELQAAQSTLDGFANTEAIDANQAKIESLTNALSNTLLTSEERTRIQTQIEKIQAENRIKQLEAQKAAQEKQVNSAAEALALQKQQLKLADQFDSNTAVGVDGATGADTDAAGRKAKVPKTPKLGKEAALLAEFGDKIDSVSGGLKGLPGTAGTAVSDMGKRFQELKDKAETSFNNIKDTISGTVNTVKEFFNTWILSNNTLKASLVGIGVVLGSIKLVEFFTGAGRALALLTTPLGTVALLAVGLGAGFAYLVSQTGSVSGAITKIKGSVDTFLSSFKSGAETGKDGGSPLSILEAQLDFSSIEGLATTAGSALGTAAAQIKVAIETFINSFTTGTIAVDLSGMLTESLTGGISDGTFSQNIITIFSIAWNVLVSGISSVFGGIGSIITTLTANKQIILDTINNTFIQPIIDGFASGDTLVGKITASIQNIFGQLPTLFNTESAAAATEIIPFSQRLEGIFNSSEILTLFEKNINEVVNMLFPTLTTAFDFSTSIGTIGDNLVAAFTTLQTAWNNITALFTGSGALSGILAENKSAFNEFITEVTSPAFIAGLQTIGTLLGVVAGAIVGVAAAIVNAALIGIMRNIADVVIEVGAGLRQMWAGLTLIASGNIIGGITELFSGLIVVVDGVFGNIADAIADTVLALLRFLKIDTSGWIGTIVQFAADFLVSFFSIRGAISIVTGIFGRLTSVIKFVVTAFTELTTGVGAGVGIWATIKGAVTGFLAILRGAPALFITIVSAVTQFGTTFAAQVATAFTTAVTNIKQFFTDLITNISEFPAKVAAKIAEGFLGIGIAIGEFISQDSIVNFAVNLISAFTKGLTAPALYSAFSQPFLAVDLSGIASLIATVFAPADIFSFIEDTWLYDTVSTFLTDTITKLKTGFTALSLSVSDIITFVSDTLTFDNIKLTLQSQIDSLKTKFTKLSLNIGDVISFVSDAGTEGLATFKTALETQASNAKAAITKVDVAVSDFFNLDTTILTSISEALTPVTEAFEKVVNIGAIPTAFTDSLTALFDLFSGNATIGDTIIAIFDAFSSVVNVKGISDGFIEKITALFDLFKSNETITNIITTVFDAINSIGNTTGYDSTLTDSISSLFEVFTNNAGVVELVDTFFSALEIIGNLTFTPDSLVSGFQQLFDLFTENTGVTTIIETVSNAFTNISELTGIEFGNPFEALTESLNNLTGFTDLSDALTSIYDSITGLLEIDLSGFSSVFEPITTAFDGLTSKVQAVIDGFNDVQIALGFKEDTDSLDTVKAETKAKLEDSALTYTQKLEILQDDGNLSEQSTKLLEAFQTSYETNSGTFATDFAKINSDLLKAGFTEADFQTLAKEAGLEVPAGLAEGLADTSNDFMGRGTRALATDFLTNIKSELGIESPSTVARDSIGIPIVEGLAQGLAFNATLQAAITTLTVSVTTSIRSAFGGTNTFNIVDALFVFDQQKLQTVIASLEEFVDAFKESYEDVKDLTETFIDEVLKLFEDFFNDLLDLTEEFVDAFIKNLEELIPRTVAVIQRLIQAIQGFESQFFTAGESLGKAFIEGFDNALQAGIPIITAAVQRIITIMANPTILLQAYNAGVDIGENFVRGIASGLNNGVSQAILAEAIRRLVAWIIDRFLAAFGISSPSKVARDLIGIQIPAGMAVGIDDGQSIVIGSINNLTTKMRKAMSQDVGENISLGLTTGIMSQRSGVLNTVADLANDLVKTMKTTLGIASPSKVSYKRIGVPFIQGIRNALVDGSGSIQEISKNLLSTKGGKVPFKLTIQDILPTTQPEIKYRGMVTNLESLLNLPESTLQYNAKISGLDNHAVNTNLTAQLTNIEQIRASLGGDIPFNVMVNGMEQFKNTEVLLTGKFNKLNQLAVQEAPIEAKYNGLLNALPDLQQNVLVRNQQVKAKMRKNLAVQTQIQKVVFDELMMDMLAQQHAKLESQNSQVRQQANQIAVPIREQRLNTIATNRVMTDNRSTSISNVTNEYHMNMTVTEQQASKVKSNFNKMRQSRKIR